MIHQGAISHSQSAVVELPSTHRCGLLLRPAWVRINNVKRREVENGSVRVSWSMFPGACLFSDCLKIAPIPPGYQDYPEGPKHLGVLIYTPSKL
jgi:hypothetical protein